MKKLAFLLTLILLSAQFYAQAVFAFSDVGENSRYFLPVTELEKEEIIQGYDDGTFKPKEKINRAEALKMIMEASGKYAEFSSTDSSFNDVSENSWFAKYVAAAEKNGIVDGDNEGNFRPWDNVNLAEALKITINSFEEVAVDPTDEGPFADIPLDSWFSGYFLYAKEHEILDVNIENNVFPSAEISRGYLAEIIYKLRKHWDGYYFGKATFYGAAVQGHGTASGKTFDMYAMTAAHKTLPFGTIVEVANIANGKTVQVEITDRGPYGYGRAIDLTSSAFEQIASLGTGVINIQYKIISSPQ